MIIMNETDSHKIKSHWHAGYVIHYLCTINGVQAFASMLDFTPMGVMLVKVKAIRITPCLDY